MEYPGLGVMIGWLGGDEETVKAVTGAIGKTIESVELKYDNLLLHFTDGETLRLFDDGQSCCERRYMTTDDNLSYYKNCTFDKIEIKEAPSVEEPYGEVHEVQFLEITTSLGAFQMASHNEHNGYYGGFWIVARED